MGLMDFFIRPEPVSYGTAKGLNTLQINRIAADLRTARDKVNKQMAKRELLEKQREAAVKVKTEAEARIKRVRAVGSVFLKRIQCHFWKTDYPYHT